MTAARIVIADDHTLVAEGLKGLLEPEFEVVEIVSNGHDLIEATARIQPDVVLVDVAMPGMNGIDAIRHLRSAGTTAKTVVLTMNTDVVYAKRALEAGATGYVQKNTVSGELVTAIREVLDGNTYVTPKIAGELFGILSSAGLADKETAGSQLSNRQCQILQLLAEGLSAKQAAARLGISRRTVETHKYRIMRTIGVETSAELIRFAVEQGIVAP
jgi:DNA-binding NarL/FixJ family response regulator